MKESRAEKLKRLREERELFSEFLEDFLRTVVSQNKICEETVAMYLVDIGIEMCALSGCPREVLDNNINLISEIAYSRISLGDD